MSKIYRFSVPGVKCGGCVTPIRNAICVSDQIIIENILVNPVTKTVDITIADSSLPEKEIKEILINTVDEVGFECLDENHAAIEVEEEDQANSPVLGHILKGVTGIVAGSILLGLCISGLGLPLIALYCLAAFGTLLTLYLGKETYYEAATNLFVRKAVTMDTLFSISTLIALAVSFASLFVPWLPMMYDAALLIFGFSHVGKALKESVNNEIESKLRFRSKAAREVDVELADAEPQNTRIKDLLPDDVIIVRRGEVIPADGECLDDSTMIYNTLRYGITYPQSVKKGSTIYAGSKLPENIEQLRIKIKGCQCSLFLCREVPASAEELNRITRNFRNNAYVIVNDQLYYLDKYQKTCRQLAIRDANKIREFKEKFATEATLAANEHSRCLFEKLSREQLGLCRSLIGHRPDPESYLALTDARLNQPGEEAPLEKTANTIMSYFVPTVLVLALASAIVIGSLFSPLTAIQCAVAILVSACPCTFGLITPLAIKIGIVKAASDSVRFKSGKPLQAAQEVDIVLLDLNGTLTKGLPQVSSAKSGVPATNIPLSLLNILAALEQQATHPFAKAIRHYIYKKAKRSFDDLSLEIAELDTSHHSGVSARIKGDKYITGNKSMMLAQGFSEAEIAAAEIPGHEAEHVIYFARNNKLIGCILLSDPLRKDAISMVNDLKAMGKEIHLCTGADEVTARKYAKRLGIEIIAADRLGESDDPEAKTKTKYINELSSLGHKVAMIGDAANDALAIKASHFGIAVESDDSDKITQQEAGAVIQKVDGNLSLRPIVTAFTVANKTIQNINQNLGFSLSYNMLAILILGGLLVGIGFVLNPAIGALLMVVQAALILTNTYSFSTEDLSCANDSVLVDPPEASGESTNSLVSRELECACKISPEHSEQLDKALSDPRMKVSTLAPSNLIPQPRPLQRHDSDNTIARTLRI